MDTDRRRRGGKNKERRIILQKKKRQHWAMFQTQHPQEILLYRQSKSLAPPQPPPHVYRTHYVATALATCLIHPAPRGHVSRGVMFSLKSRFLKALWFVLLKTAYITLRVRVVCALMRPVAGAPPRARCLFTFSSWLPPRRSCLPFCLIHMGPPKCLQGCSQEGMRQERSVRMTSVYFPWGTLA